MLKRLLSLLALGALLLAPAAALTPQERAVVINARSVTSTVFPVTSGQNLLLRARDITATDNTTIATWSDTAGVGPYDLTQSTAGNRPTFASSGANDDLPYLSFENNTASRTIANSSYPLNKRSGSIFFVVDWNTLSSSKYIVTFGGGTTLVLMQDSDHVFKRFSGGSTPASSLGKVPSGKRIAYLVTFGTSAVKVYIDKSTNVQSLSAEAAGSITGIQIGGSGVLKAKLYEVRGFDRELTSGEAAQILDLWSPAVYNTGITIGTPSGRIITDGDSITEGLGATRSFNWPYFLNPANNWFAYDYAISGQTWANLIARQATTNAFAAAGNYLIVNCGSNDVGTGRSAAQIQTDFQTYMNAAVAAGFDKSKIVVTTLHLQNPGTGGARNGFNTWLRANYTTYAGTLFDVAADTDLGINETTNVPNNSSYWADGVHFTDAGYRLYDTKMRLMLGAVPF